METDNTGQEHAFINHYDITTREFLRGCTEKNTSALAEQNKTRSKESSRKRTDENGPLLQEG